MAPRDIQFKHLGHVVKPQEIFQPQPIYHQACFLNGYPRMTGYGLEESSSPTCGAINRKARFTGLFWFMFLLEGVFW